MRAVVQPAPKIVAVPRIASTQPAVQKSTPRESWRARGFLSARATPTTTEKVGVSRRGASLIGIFGDADGRYALVQTQRGKVARERQGEERVRVTSPFALARAGGRVTGMRPAGPRRGGRECRARGACPHPIWPLVPLDIINLTNVRVDEFDIYR